MPELGVGNQDEPEQQIRPGRAPDRTPQIQRLRVGRLVNAVAMGVELPRKRTGLTPVARDKHGVPVVMSNLPPRKVRAPRLRAQRQTRSPRFLASVAPRPSPAPAPAPGSGFVPFSHMPTSIPAPGFFSTEYCQVEEDSMNNVNDNTNFNDKAATITATATATNVHADVPAREPAGGEGESVNTNGGRSEHAGKLTLISAEQLEDLRADLIQSARENSDLRHEVAILERKLARAEGQKETYWACGIEWARREKALHMELEYWRAQAEATERSSHPSGDGVVKYSYGFVGGRGFGGPSELDVGQGQGQGQGLGLGLRLGFGINAGFEADFDAGFGAADFGADLGTDFDAEFGAGPDLDLVAAGGELELEMERDVMLRVD